MKKKLTIEEIRKLKLPIKLISDNGYERIVIDICGDQVNTKTYLAGEFYSFGVDSIGWIADSFMFEVPEPKITMCYRWLCLNPKINGNVYKHTEYFKEGEQPHYALKRLDNDFIRLDDNNKIVEK